MKLTDKMSEYATLQKRLNILKKDITEEVIKLKKTISIEQLTASYNSGRTTFEYEEAARRIKGSDLEFIEAVDKNSKVVTDWRSVCVLLDIDKENIKSTKSAPSVTIKVK